MGWGGGDEGGGSVCCYTEQRKNEEKKQEKNTHEDGEGNKLRSSHLPLAMQCPLEIKHELCIYSDSFQSSGREDPYALHRIV